MKKNIKQWFDNNISYEIRYILLLFITTRSVLIIIGVCSRIILEPISRYKYVWVYSKHLWLDIWGVWDSGWYLSIANQWYPAIKGIASSGSTNYGFFPLYPLLMRWLGKIIGGNTFVAGLIISNLSLFVACIFLYKLVKLKLDRSTALRSIKYLFLFPTAFILSGVFTESLFLALLIIAFYYAEKQKWKYVGIAGFFLAITRPIGVFIVLPIGFQYLKSKEFNFHKIKIDFSFLLFFPLGLLIFAIYTYLLTGDFFAYIHSKQIGWSFQLSNPFSIIYNSILHGNLFSVFNIVFAIIIIILLCVNYKKIGFSYFSLGLLAIFVPLISGGATIIGLMRFSLIIFPLYIIAAKVTSDYKYDLLLTLVFCLLQGFLMVFWAIGSQLVV